MNAKKVYLVGYNAAMLVGWGAVFVLGWTHLAAHGFGPAGTTGDALFGAMGAPLVFFQLLMLLDVVHAATGLVPSPLVTAAMQVASRVLVVVVLWAWPASRTTLLGQTLLLCAWVPTELIRYTYYALRTLGFRDDAIPRPLLWLRYSAFTVLYPTGISGELCVLWASLPQIRAHPQWRPLAFFIYGVFAVYPVGAFILYNHMLRLRRKALAGTTTDSSSSKGKKKSH